MEEKPLILVTNDDGYDAPGIKALAEAMQEVGDVYVVAPKEERSASSHSLNIKEPLVPERIDEHTYAVNGTPADCVYLALERRDLLCDPPPELLAQQPKLVVSGINDGPNLGDDVHRSGTVAGAREAAFHGVRAFAMSLVVERPRMLDLFKERLGFPNERRDFSAAADYAHELATYVLRTDIGWRTFLNVNVPAGQPNGSVMTVLGPRPGESQGGAELSKGLGPWVDIHEKYKTDGAAVFLERLISVTPLQTDATNSWVLDKLAKALPHPSPPSRVGAKP